MVLWDTWSSSFDHNSIINQLLSLGTALHTYRMSAASNTLFRANAALKQRTTAVSCGDCSDAGVCAVTYGRPRHHCWLRYCSGLAQAAQDLVTEA
jgi:hypothetical protein